MGFPQRPFYTSLVSQSDQGQIPANMARGPLLRHTFVVSPALRQGIRYKIDENVL